MRYKNELFSNILDFCLEEALPGIHKAIESNQTNKIIEVVVKKANRDALSGARFWDKNYSEHSNYYKAELTEILTTSPNLSSKQCIEYILARNQYSAKVGSIQKLVNMSMKYLYILTEFEYAVPHGLNIDFEKCDCPLDSNILKKLSEKNDIVYKPWTQILTIDEYSDIQRDISKLDEIKKSNLEFDLKYWGKK